AVGGQARDAVIRVGRRGGRNRTDRGSAPIDRVAAHGDVVRRDVPGQIYLGRGWARVRHESGRHGRRRRVSARGGEGRVQNDAVRAGGPRLIDKRNVAAVERRLGWDVGITGLGSGRRQRGDSRGRGVGTHQRRVLQGSRAG